MSLNATTCASSLNTAIDSYTTTFPAGNFTSGFVSAYKAYSQAGVLSSGGGVAGTENDSILTSFFNGFSSYTSDAAFGQAMADYWSTCLRTPVAPATSLTNNASTKVAAFTAAIAGAYRTTDTQPYYQHLILAIEDVVKTIQWTVTLSVPPYSRIEMVS